VGSTIFEELSNHCLNDGMS